MTIWRHDIGVVLRLSSATPLARRSQSPRRWRHAFAYRTRRKIPPRVAIVTRGGVTAAAAPCYLGEIRRRRLLILALAPVVFSALLVLGPLLTHRLFLLFSPYCSGSSCSPPRREAPQWRHPEAPSGQGDPGCRRPRPAAGCERMSWAPRCLVNSSNRSDMERLRSFETTAKSRQKVGPVGSTF